MDLGPVGQAGHPVVQTANISGKTFLIFHLKHFLTVYHHGFIESTRVTFT